MTNISINLNGIVKLSKLRRDKSAGPDEVKPNVVKELRNEIFLFEKLLAIGLTPSDWTKTNIVPFLIMVTRSTLLIKAHLLACILWKAMEHVIIYNLTKHLNNHNDLYDVQYGFRLSGHVRRNSSKW